jgi:hypothetical protein
MRLIACLSVFNEIELLPRCLQALRDVADRAIAVDGAYRGFPAAQAASDDGTWELLQSVECESVGWLRAVPAPAGFWPNQEIKRTEYLRRADDIAKSGDWLLQVDADEIVLEDAPGDGFSGLKDFLRHTSADCVFVAMQEWNEREPVGRVSLLGKVYRWSPGLHYGEEHWLLHRADGTLLWGPREMLPPQSCADRPHFRLAHLSGFRPAERKQAKSRFAEHMARWREQHRVSNPESGTSRFAQSDNS